MFKENGEGDLFFFNLKKIRKPYMILDLRISNEPVVIMNIKFFVIEMNIEILTFLL